MITTAEANAVVSAISYRNWTFSPGVPSVSDIMLNVSDHDRVFVHVTYDAPNSSNPSRNFHNDFTFSFPLPETEAEVARAVFEAVTVIEDHERREFFKVATNVYTDRPTDDFDPRPRETVFHPHGWNRNALFHALDPFATKVRGDLKAYGQQFKADAV